jgi:hypothetical protein
VSTGGHSCPGRRRPHGPIFFFFFESDGSDGGAASASGIVPGRRRPHGLSEMMAAMPPRPTASFTYAFYLFASVAYAWGNLDRVRVSGMFADI